MDSDRRPTAQQLEELIDLVRREPASSAFLQLGEAYLMLGRPRDVVGVCGVGLTAAPNSLEGRVMLARAFAAMHQWKEAQVELLRVVKVDRSNRLAFSLLGEVLLRRADYDRAIPVLSHAQILDPTSPQILMMLKKARGQQPLDPPAPVPQPVPPRGEAASMAYAPPASSMNGRSNGANGAYPQPQIQSQMPMSGQVQMPQAPPPPRVVQAPPPPPPPQQVPDVRPRLIVKNKVQNAAAASLRQSAAVGEGYLAELIGGGLLDVAGVRVPDVEYDLRPDRRWSRSTRRAFVFLFVVAVLGVSGGGTWTWWQAKKKAEEIGDFHRNAKASLVFGTYAELTKNVKSLELARDKSPGDLETLALLSESAGLDALLYGDALDDATDALDKLGSGNELAPDDPGYHEAARGKVATMLAKLAQGDKPNPDVAAVRAQLADAAKNLGDMVAADKTDLWARWLLARVQLAAGDRKEADVSLALAGEGSGGLAVATIDQADLLADDGDLDKALDLYAAVLVKAPNHPLAVIGRAFAKVEANYDARGVISDELGTLDKEVGPRVAAYRALTEAIGQLALENYTNANDAIKLAVARPPPLEARFWAGMAWQAMLRGKLAEAQTARAKIPWYGSSKLDEQPFVKVIEAARQTALGRPDRALDLDAKLRGPRASLVRTYALLELARPKEALDEANQLFKHTTPKAEKGDDEPRTPSVEVAILQAEADRMVSGPPTGDDLLRKLALQANGKLGRYAYGQAWRVLGNFVEAATELENATTGVDELTAPNPVLDRTYTALADAKLSVAATAKPADQPALIDAAKAALDKALAMTKDFPPAKVVAAKLALRQGDADAAASMIAPLVTELGGVMPSVKLIYAEALILKKSPDVDQAKTLLDSIKDKMLPPSEVGRVANLIDTKLPAELNVPVPPDAPGPPGAVVPPPTPGQRHR